MALGDTITILMLRSINGYGSEGDVISVLETLQVEAIISNGWARLYTGVGVPTPVGSLLTSAPQFLSEGARQQVRWNFGLGNSSPLARQERRERRLGAVSADITSVAVGASSALGKVYSATSGANVVNPAFPVEWGEGLDVGIVSTGGGGLWVYPSNPPGLTPHSLRFMTDSTEVDVGLWNVLAISDVLVFVDNAPYTSNPVTITANQYLKITFPTSAPRLVEIRSRCPVFDIHVGSIYKVWKPRRLHGPRTLIVGSSYGAPVVWNGAAAANESKGPYFDLGDYLNTEEVWLDCIGGTGFIRRTGTGLGAPNNNFLDRLAQHVRAKPDVIVFESGAANDLFNGNTVGDIVAAVMSYLTQARVALPDCRFVYVEGHAPPVTYSTYGPTYQTISTALLSAAADVGLYVVDTQTDPWFYGTGYTPGHTTGDGNADVYIGDDGIHPTIAGAAYLKRRLAPKIQAVIAGTATVNTRI